MQLQFEDEIIVNVLLHAVHTVLEVQVAQLVKQLKQLVPFLYVPDGQVRQIVPGETQVAQPPLQGCATLL